jgi:hypothetical protein
MFNSGNARRIIKTLHDAHPDPLTTHLLEDLMLACFGSDVVDGLTADERHHLSLYTPGSNHVISVIKSVRARHLGKDEVLGTLKGAKDLVDAYLDKNPLKEG